MKVNKTTQSVIFHELLFYNTILMLKKLTDFVREDGAAKAGEQMETTNSADSRFVTLVRPQILPNGIFSLYFNEI